MNKYIDFELIEKYPNKYDILPKDIKNLKVLDWDKLKKLTWFNKAMRKPCWCHLEGCTLNPPYDDENEFWIGFYEDGSVDYHFYSYGGMCGYEFDEFYKSKHIEHKWDMIVQVNAMKFINKILDEKVVELNKE